MRIETRYFIIIFFIFLAACIETDIYLPSFPDMMQFYSVNEEQIQQLLTWNFLGLCLSGLAYGPLSDSFGRKKPLLIALGIFLIGSVVTVVAQSFSWMLAGRVLQGLGSGGCFTLGTAILFDVFKEKKAVQALSRMNTIVPFLLASAPIVGGYLNYMFGFKSNFLLIAALVLFSFVLCLCSFEETLQEKKPFQWQDFRKIGTNATFWKLTCIISFLFAGYLAFLADISVLFVTEMGVSKAAFPFYQASVLMGYLIASVSCSYAVAKWGAEKVKIVGMVASGLGVASVMLLALLKPLPGLLTLAMMPYAFGFIWAQTPYVTEVMELMPEIKGIAASLLTSARLLITAAVVGLSSHLYNGTIMPLAIILIVVYVAIYTSAKSIKPSRGST